MSIHTYIKPVCVSVTLSRLSCCTDFNDIWHGDTLVFEEGQKLLVGAITDTYADTRAKARRCWLLTILKSNSVRGIIMSRKQVNVIR